MHLSWDLQAWTRESSLRSKSILGRPWPIGCASRTVHSVVGKIYDQIGYSGFSEQAYSARLKRQYPERPKITTSEAEVKKLVRNNHIEGIWSGADGSVFIFASFACSDQAGSRRQGRDGSWRRCRSSGRFQRAHWRLGLCLRRTV